MPSQGTSTTASGSRRSPGSSDSYSCEDLCTVGLLWQVLPRGGPSPCVWLQGPQGSPSVLGQLLGKQGGGRVVHTCDCHPPIPASPARFRSCCHVRSLQ